MNLFYNYEYRFFCLMNLKYIVKCVLIILFFKNLIDISKSFSKNIYLNQIIENPIQYSFSIDAINITNINKIYFTTNNISYTYSDKYDLIEVKYYIRFYGYNGNYITPSIIHLLYDLHILCKINIFDTNEKIYSLAYIHENMFYICIEYMKTTEHANFGIIIYKTNVQDEEIEYNEFFFLKINKLLIIILFKNLKMMINLI